MLERPVPDFPGYFALENGTIKHPSGHIVTQYTNPDDYQMVRVTHGIMKYVHRLVASAFVVNPRPDIFIEVDHIDGDPMNNKPCNLRYLTHQLNMLSNRSLGCSFDKKFKKWCARVRVFGKLYNLGYYKTFLEAHKCSKVFRQIAFNMIYQKYVDEATRVGTNILREEPNLVPTPRGFTLPDSGARWARKVRAAYVLLRNLLQTS